MVSMYQAIRGLEANAQRLDPQKEPTAWNWNQALLAMAQTLERIGRDQEYILNRLQVIEHQLSDD